MGLSYWGDNRWSGSWAAYGPFDPQNGDVWYFMVQLYFDWTRLTVIQGRYMGAHAVNTPGRLLPDCGFNGGVQPCVQFTIMQPNKSDSIPYFAPAFSPAYRASGYQANYWILVGISSDGELVVNTREAGGQDTKGWTFVFTLGDRTPTGAGPNSFRPIAVASSYRTPPGSWCTIHRMVLPDAGWVGMNANDFGIKGAAASYAMRLTATAMNANTNVPGGLNACPANPLGVTGLNCTAIAVSGEPANVGDGSVLQASQVGDVIVADSEYMRIVSKASSTSLVVQRAYILSAPAAHSVGAALYMSCGSRNRFNTATTLWNYRADPYGTNSNGASMIFDPNLPGGHSWNSHYVSIASGSGPWDPNISDLCPASVLTASGGCYIVRLGDLSSVVSAPMMAVAEDPPFAGVVANGVPNQVDSHPGYCAQTWCFDSRPLNGGTTLMVGSPGSPFVNITGQLWKFAGAQTILHRKILNTAAYAGDFPLVDVSGPGSAIPADSTGSYEYCYALAAGECYSGSAAGDVYLNAPYVSYPYCHDPGVAVYPEHTNSLCVGDLSAYTANLVQVGVASQDIFGSLSRRLGADYARWNQME